VPGDASARHRRRGRRADVWPGAASRPDGGSEIQAIEKAIEVAIVG
jgi:hypothetical protein